MVWKGFSAKAKVKSENLKVGTSVNYKCLRLLMGAFLVLRRYKANKKCPAKAGHF